MSDLPKEAPLELTAKQRQAALRVAEDVLTDVEIAKEARVSRTTLHTWKKDLEFKAQVKFYIEELAGSVAEFAIARKADRVKSLNDRKKLLLQIIRARVAIHTGKEPPWLAPGADTGLIVRSIKGLGKGDDFEKVELFGLDTDILSELRALEIQAAKEMEQIVERKDITSGGKSLDLLGVGEISEDELNDRIARAESRKAKEAL